MLMVSILVFSELATKKRNYAHDFFLIMVFERIMLLMETMSRYKTRSWLLRDLHCMEENHSRRNTCPGP
jgi:hypothetical protein